MNIILLIVGLLLITAGTGSFLQTKSVLCSFESRNIECQSCFMQDVGCSACYDSGLGWQQKQCNLVENCTLQDGRTFLTGGGTVLYPKCTQNDSVSILPTSIQPPQRIQPKPANLSNYFVLLGVALLFVGAMRK